MHDKAQRPAPSSPSKIKMLKEEKKHIDKEQGKTKPEAPRSVNFRPTQNKNIIGTTALERSVVHTTYFLYCILCVRLINVQSPSDKI